MTDNPESLARSRRRRGIYDPNKGLADDGSEYTRDEVEFMLAIEKYKRERQRPYPTFREVLSVARSLGYRKGF
jgi:hypothetical protein